MSPFKELKAMGFWGFTREKVAKRRRFAVAGAGLDDNFFAVIALDGNSAVDQARLHQSGPRGITEVHGNAIRARWRLRLPGGRRGGKRNAENCSRHNEGWETLGLIIHDFQEYESLHLDFPP